MTQDPERLRRLAALLDQAFDVAVTERETWLAGLQGEDADLAPTLRELLARQASRETADLFLRPPAFTVGAVSRSASELRPGDTVGAYCLERLLGHGGMGEVWLAARSDGSLKRKVALKLPHLSWVPGLAQRFAREREILSGLEHPNIARLYDAGIDRQGRPFMALEYVEGEPIDAYCTVHALPIAARVELLLQVAGAVAFAHSRLVLHRDLKPGNMLVTSDGQVRLLDFGIAKLMEDGATHETALTQVAGRALTLDYASPEQIRGTPIGTASDVYSLGVVAFELLTGTRPYRLKRGSAAELEEAIIAAVPPLASQAAADAESRRALRGDLDAILQQALRKDPAQRYASVDVLAQDLERYLRGDPVLARPDSAGYRLRKFIGRNRAAVGAATAVLLAIVSGAGVAIWQASVARTQTEEARAQAALARKEAQRAQAVQGFMIDLFRTNTHQQANPLRAQQATARELLDIGAARVSDALKDAPESEVQVLNTLSDMYVQLGLREKSLALQRRSVEVARRVHGPGDAARADALLGYVAVLHETPERTTIPALLDEARTALDAAGEATTFLRGALLLETARYYRYEALEPARDSADAAVAFFRQHHPQRASLITAYRLAGLARMQGCDYPQAEAMFQSAVDTSRLRGPGAPAWLVGGLGDLGEAQQAQLKLDAAEESFRQALAYSVKVNGESHRETLLTRLKLANVLLLTGRDDEGLALQAAVQLAIDREPHRFDAAWRANATDLIGATLFARGRPMDVALLLEADLQTLRAKLPHSGARIHRELLLAEAWIAMGRLADARPLLARAIADRRSQLGNNASTVALLEYLRVDAQLQRAEGSPATALEILAAIPADAMRIQGAEPIRIDIERAHALSMMGKGGEGVDAARRALDALRSLPATNRMPHLEADAWQALGECELARGDRRAARDALDRALALRRAHDASGSVWRARLESKMSEAKLQTPQARPVARQ